MSSSCWGSPSALRLARPHAAACSPRLQAWSLPALRPRDGGVVSNAGSDGREGGGALCDGGHRPLSTGTGLAGALWAALHADHALDELVVARGGLRRGRRLL